MNFEREFNQFKGVVITGIKNAIAYKFEFLIWTFLTPIWLAVIYFVWKSIYAYSGVEVIRGFTLLGFINYMIIAQFVKTITGTFVDEKIAEYIRRGTLVKHIVKPIGFFKRKFYSNLGHRCFAFLVQSLPLLIFAYLVFDLNITRTYAGLFLISASLAMILNYFFVLIFGLMAFWFIRIGGLLRLRDGVGTVLAGLLVPIAFFPSWLQDISSWLPFQYTIYVPAQIFLQNFSLIESIRSMAVQVIWIIVLYLIAAHLWNKGYSKFSGVGV